MPYYADVRFIASIYPGQVAQQRRNYGVTTNSEPREVPPEEAKRYNLKPQRDGRYFIPAERSTTFNLEPVPRGKPAFVLPVYDSFEELLDVLALSTQSGSKQKPRTSKPVPVDTIVADLLRCWTGGLHDVPQGATPGIIEIKPMKVELEKFAEKGSLPGPNPGELREMTAAQTTYFEYLFTRGELLHKKSEWKEITETMRVAAEWLGFEREWSHRAIARESGPCPLCTKIIPNAAVFCPECGQQIKQMPPELAAIHAQNAALQAQILRK